MSERAIETIGVVGAGQMGNGIAHVFAQAGLRVIMTDVTQELVDRGVATIDRNLQRGVDKGRMTEEEKKRTLGLIESTTEMEQMGSADFVIEAIVEDLRVKRELFGRLGRGRLRGPVGDLQQVVAVRLREVPTLGRVRILLCPQQRYGAF